MDILFDFIWLIPIYPLLAFVIIVVGLNKNKKASSGLAIGAMVLATIHSVRSHVGPHWVERIVNNLS